MQHTMIIKYLHNYTNPPIYPLSMVKGKVELKLTKANNYTTVSLINSENSPHNI